MKAGQKITDFENRLKNAALIGVCSNFVKNSTFFKAMFQKLRLIGCLSGIKGIVCHNSAEKSIKKP